MLSPVEVISIAQTVLERSTLTPRSRYGFNGCSGWRAVWS